MHDIKEIRKNPEEFDKLLGRRGLEPRSKEILDLDSKLRFAKQQIQEMQEQENKKAKQVAIAKHKEKEYERIDKEFHDRMLENYNDNWYNEVLTAQNAFAESIKYYKKNGYSEDAEDAMDQARDAYYASMKHDPERDSEIKSEISEIGDILNFVDSFDTSADFFDALDEYLETKDPKDPMAYFLEYVHEKEKDKGDE
jgi:seryl-tRNA synthetase